MTASWKFGASSRWYFAWATGLFIMFSSCGGDTNRPGETSTPQIAPNTNDGLQACTLVGCLNGLSVTVSGNTNGESLSVEVTSTGDTTPRVVQCRAFGGPCPSFFADFFPTQVSIKVITAFDTVVYDATPMYVTSLPNGPDCGPECRSATVAVMLGLNPSPNGGVTVYKSRGDQCSTTLLDLNNLQTPLRQAGITVTSASCGIDGFAHAAVCGAASGFVGFFEVAPTDIAAAQGLGFAAVSTLPPEARRTAC